MSRPLLLVCLALLGVTAACGHKIGDSCVVSSDCSSDGTRVCDTFSPGGYCTIEGCDFGTCPEEAVCVRFFPAVENAASCATEACQPDEICTIAKLCAPRSIELRFCMATCDGNGDCRGGYECRDQDLMVRHGGEPVPDPLAAEPTIPDTRFCAARRTCSRDTDCDPDERCEPSTRICTPR